MESSSWPRRQQVGREVDPEHMFDKIVTPSDVGKLNRLVIPKQYAEKHFPLHPSSATAGLILSFEDRGGKQWRFRYSYWNSSQSYVMTKGWSRFVKEKHLSSGDTVSFGRGHGKFFIDSTSQYRTPSSSVQSQIPFLHYSAASTAIVSPSTMRTAVLHPFFTCDDSVVLDSIPVARGVVVLTGHNRAVRLFGVNLEAEEKKS